MQFMRSQNAFQPIGQFFLCGSLAMILAVCNQTVSMKALELAGFLNIRECISMKYQDYDFSQTTSLQC